MTFVLSPPGQHGLPLLAPGYLMFFVNIGQDSERQREYSGNQTIRRTWVCINRCFHLSPLKSTLPNRHISITRSRVLQICVISSEHLILSSVPLHHLPASITADDFAIYFKDKTKTISSQFSPSLTLLKLPSSPSVPSLRRKYPNFSSPTILQHVL